jgi:hypothetical protein
MGYKIPTPGGGDDDSGSSGASLESPVFTGTPTAPTPAQGTNTEQLATTAYVQTEAGLLIPKSVLTTDGDILTRSGGVPARMTRAQLAADAAFTGTYAPLSASQVWIPAATFGVTENSPALSTVAGRYRCMLFDSASSERVSCTQEVPSTWATMNVSLYWTNFSSGSGNVVWRLFVDTAGDGDTLVATGGAGDSGELTIAAPSQDILKVSSLLSGQAIDASKVLNFRIARIGNAVSGNDTLNNDAAMLGLLVTRAS